MKKIFASILFLALSLSACSQTKCSSYSEDYIPKNLTDALQFLDCSWSDKDKEAYKKLQEDDLVEFHFGTGLGIRNNWGLWEGENKLVKDFNKIGIKHPDDMSSIILLSFHRKLNSKDIRLEEQVAYYKSYWKNTEKQKDSFELETDSLYKSFHKGDVVKVYYHLDNNKAKPRIQLVWAYSSVEELKAKNQPFCEIKGVVLNDPLNKYYYPTLKIRIIDLCGFKEVQFGENESLKIGEKLDFDVYPNSLIEKIK